VFLTAKGAKVAQSTQRSYKNMAFYQIGAHIGDIGICFSKVTNNRWPLELWDRLCGKKKNHKDLKEGTKVTKLFMESILVFESENGYL
jgi:hypothetical protein